MDIGFIRPRKGLSKTAQREIISVCDCTHVWTIGENCDCLADVVTTLRSNERLVVANAKLLLDPHKRHQKLHDAINHMVAIGISMFDVEAQEEYKSEADLLRMALLALSAPKGPNNGKLGRPTLKYTDKHLEAAKAIWVDPKYRKTKDAVYAMNSQLYATRTGASSVGPWTVRRAFAKLGNSMRNTTEEQSE